jgi:hypothetical protein
MVRRRRDEFPGGASSGFVGLVVSVSWSTRGQTDMRGLVTAGRVFGWSVPRV